MWEPKMNPNTIKEEPRSGLDCDTLFTWCQNFHLREPIVNHKDTIMTIFGGGKN
jgi:hypothetical protein